MDIGLSTRMYANQRLTSHVLDLIYNAGIRQFEIFATRQHLDYYDANHVRDVAQWFTDRGASLHSVHAPPFAGVDGGRSGGLAISPAYTEKRLRIQSMDEIKRAIEIAERLPFRYLVVHMGRPDDVYDVRKFDAAFTSLEHLRIFAKERGAQILLENGMDPLSEPFRLVEFIQYTRLEVKVCFDTGHAHLAGGVLPALELLKPYIAALDLHDNHQEKDDHLLPFSGSIDWPEVCGQLRQLGASVHGQIELHHDSAENTLAGVQEAIRRFNE